MHFPLHGIEEPQIQDSFEYTIYIHTVQNSSVNLITKCIPTLERGNLFWKPNLTDSTPSIKEYFFSAQFLPVAFESLVNLVLVRSVYQFSIVAIQILFYSSIGHTFDMDLTGLKPRCWQSVFCCEGSRVPVSLLIPVAGRI